MPAPLARSDMHCTVLHCTALHGIAVAMVGVPESCVESPNRRCGHIMRRRACGRLFLLLMSRSGALAGNKSLGIPRGRQDRTS